MRKLFLLSALLTTGCAGNVIVVDGIEIYDRVWDRTSDELTRRSSAELNCSGVSLTLLRREGREPVEVLAVGCGRRGMYVRPMMQAGSYRAIGSWQLTTMIRDDSGQPAAVSGSPEPI